MSKVLLALDTLLDETDIEEATAVSAGWELQRWDGASDSLAVADAVVHVVTTVAPALIRQLARCRVIGRFGTGLDTVDLEAAARAGMTVVRVKDYCTAEMTAHTVALALALLRLRGQAARGAPAVQPGWGAFRGQYPIPGHVKAHVVGYGAVGAGVAAALSALQMETLVTTRHQATAASVAGYEVVPFDEGLARADIILFHLDFSAETSSVFGPAHLGRVKHGALVVNTARLALTDEQALAQGLVQGVLGGVGLDARLAPGSPIWPLVGRDDLIVTPHVGWYSEASLSRLRRAAVADTIAAYNGLTGDRPAALVKEVF